MMAKPHNLMKNKYHTNHNRLRNVLLGLVVVACSTGSGMAYAKKKVEPVSVAVAPISIVDPFAPVHENTDEFSRYSYTLEELGALGPIELRSVDGRRNVSFSLRNDEVITAARLSLNYAWSPALIPELSHLKISLNDELMSTLPLSREDHDGRTSEIKLDPSMFIDFNKLTLGQIAHYTRECEDPAHSTLWSIVSNQSKLDLIVRHLRLPDDLALLPAPFFDKLDNRKLILPFIFPAKPNNEVLHAAGVVASWFGSLASYRGAQFPVLLDSLPKGNGVIMVVGNTAPAGLNLPAISGAGLAVVTNPLNPNAKLLVIMGRDAKELDLAAQALALGKATLNGSYVGVSSLEEIPARKPYDAPNWLPTDRKVHIAELVKSEQLQAEGLSAEPITLNFNIPPDIFGWRSEGVPLDLHYRYTPRPQPDRSTLNVTMNNLFVQAMPLESLPSRTVKNLKLPFLKDGMAVNKELVLIPHDNIFGQNQLQLYYYFDYTKQGACKDVFLNNERGAIDDDSSIDFSSFPHFTALPNLNFFVNDGFPYTRMADLSETAVIMPDNASSLEMETYLAVMGRMGKVTGYPAIRHVLTVAENVDANANKDLILIGTAANQPLMARWADKMHPILQNGLHNLKLPGAFDRLLSRWKNRDLDDAMHRAGDLVTKGESGLGALVAFESPLKSGRSVVAFTGDTSEQISSLSLAISEAKTSQLFHGDLVLQSGKRIEGFQMGPTYYVGKLPWWTSLSWHLSNQPLALVLLIGLVSLLVAVMAFRYLRRLSALRLRK